MMLFKIWFVLCWVLATWYELRRFPWAVIRSKSDMVFTVLFNVLSGLCMAVMLNVLLLSFLWVVICSN